MNEEIEFSYRFFDETNTVSNSNIEMRINKNDGLHLDDIMETFSKFLTACGYTVDSIKKYLD